MFVGSIWKALPVTLALALAPTLAIAEADCSFPYMTFEYAVPHVDLEACPAGVADGAVFCRASIAGDQLHVFVFEEGGDQCLVKVASYFEGEFAITIE